MTCNTCTNLRTKTTTGKGHFLLWECDKNKKIQFGNTTDFRAKKNFPKNCKDYQRMEWMK